MNWIKENWFKLGILIAIIILVDAITIRINNENKPPKKAEINVIKKISEVITTGSETNLSEKIEPKKIEQKAPEFIQVNTTPISEPEKLKISGVQVIPSAYSTNFNWKTSLKSDSKITIWPTNTPSGNLEIKSTKGTSHSVDVSSIPNKNYFYTISAEIGGQTAVTEEKNFTTPSDNIKPKISKIDISSNKDSGVIKFKIYADEPIKASLFYKYLFAPQNDGLLREDNNIILDSDSNKLIKDPEYYNIYVMTILKPSYTVNTILDYSFLITDRSGNISTEEDKINVSTINNI